MLLAAAPSVGTGTLLGALDVQTSDGPWERPDDLNKFNALLRYSRGDTRNGFSATVMGYRASWNSTDQIPQRAVADGRIGRFGLVDASDGGESSRYSASIEWQRTNGNATTSLAAYGLKDDLDLFSNFTYFLDDPVNGDQFQQTDHRLVTGARLTHRRIGRWAGRSMQNTIGLQFRNDAISDVGLYHTRERQQLETIRQDSVIQTSAGAFVQNEAEWAPWLRTLAGLRVDGYRFNVDAALRENAGRDSAGLVSPKGGAIFGPFARTEFYVNAGRGFHSNDARGATITVDPVTGQPANRVTPLARATGAEFGVRTIRIPRMQMTLTAWTLGLDSELVFVGDAGTTQPGRPSRRRGLEWTTYYAPKRWLILDADAAVSDARFTDADPAGNHIPGAVATVVSAGATLESWRRSPAACAGAISVRAHSSKTAPSIEGNKPRQPHRRIHAHVFSACRARRLQSLQRAEQRHRLLLPIAAARGADGWHRRHPHASDGAANGAAECDYWILTVFSRWSAVPVVSLSLQSQSSV